MEQDIYLYPGSQSEAHRLGEAALWDWSSFHCQMYPVRGTSKPSSASMATAAAH